MILAIDVQYNENTAFVAGVLFEDWQSDAPSGEYVSIVKEVAEYEPGSFYKRELPCILSLLDEHKLLPTCIVVDGYVYLDGEQQPGLGKHLYDALGGKIEVIGVAKKGFAGISAEYEVIRGKSEKPLYVTTTGDLPLAKKLVQKMAGRYRIPTLLKRADQVCRQAEKLRETAI